MNTNTKGIFKAILAATWRYILCAIVGFIIGVNCKGCTPNVTPVKTKTDRTIIAKLDSLKFQNECHLYTIDVLKKKVAVLDSLTKIVKPAYQKAKKENRAVIQNNPCDSVAILAAYDATVSKCDTVILVDSLKIVDLKKVNNRLEVVQLNLNAMLALKDTLLAKKEIDLGIEKKKVKVQKRKKIVAIGILAVIATIFILK